MSKIHNIHSLDSELRHLKKKAGELEKKLDHNANELRKNFGGMTWNSLLGTVREQSIIAGVADRILHSAKLQDNVYGAIDKVASFVATVKSKFSKQGPPPTS